MRELGRDLPRRCSRRSWPAEAATAGGWIVRCKFWTSKSCPFLDGGEEQLRVAVFWWLIFRCPADTDHLMHARAEGGGCHRDQSYHYCGGREQRDLMMMPCHVWCVCVPAVTLYCHCKTQVPNFDQDSVRILAMSSHVFSVLKS